MRLTQQEIDTFCDEFGFSYVTYGNIMKLLGDVYEMFQRAWLAFRRAAEKYWEYLKAQQERNERRKRHKLEFARPIIRSQVIDRKPRCLIKKIIRG